MMRSPRRWIGLDFIKLAVSLSLAAIFFVLFLQFPEYLAGLSGPLTAPTALPSIPPEPSGTPFPTTTQPPAPSATPEPTATVQPSATSAPTEQPSPVPPTLAPSASPTLTAKEVIAGCPTTLRSQLKVGYNAQVTTTLNMRAAPSLDSKLITPLSGNTLVAVIGGPVCTPATGGAYLWWEVKLKNKLTGWAIEGSLDGSTRFLSLVY